MEISVFASYMPQWYKDGLFATEEEAVQYGASLGITAAEVFTDEFNERSPEAYKKLLNGAGIRLGGLIATTQFVNPDDAVYHKEFENIYEYNFYKERADKKLKTFVKVKDYDSSLSDSNIINFVAFDNYDKIRDIAEKIKSIEGVTVNYYKDVYEDCYFLEAYSSEASKANGIKYLSKYINYSKVICFGDNLNDIPMFELADEAYATANAAEEIKKIATDVIGSCEEDGVAEFLANRFKTK